MLPLFVSLRAAFEKRPGKMWKRILLSVTTLVTIVFLAVFLFFLPKYTVVEAYDILSADSAYENGIVEPSRGVCAVEGAGNPFVSYGYKFWFSIDGADAGTIWFDPVSGEYALDEDWAR